MRTLAIALGILLAPALASADDAAKPNRTTDVQQMKTDDCARATKQHKQCVLNMGEGETIDGSSPTAGGSAINILDYAKIGSLIHLRRDFITEILKTAEDTD